MRTPIQGLRAAELAWVLLSLLGVGITLRANGWCTGLLSARDLCVTQHGVGRTPVRSGAQVRTNLRRARRHLAEGHDTSCEMLGVPLPTLRKVITTWGESRAHPYVVSLVDEILAELQTLLLRSSKAWSERDVRDIIEHVVTRSITPTAPAMWRNRLDAYPRTRTRFTQKEYRPSDLRTSAG